MPEKDVVQEALKECYDPEIPVNIVDLGLIYDVRINGSSVEVDMTLTAPGCPMAANISENVRQRLLQVDGIDDVVINVVWDPPWTSDRMSEEAKKSLGFQ